MTTEASFSANDASVRVHDKDTELVKARAAAAYYQTEVEHTADVIERLQEKKVKMQKHLDALDEDIKAAKRDHEDAKERKAAADNVVTDLGGTN